MKLEKAILDRIGGALSASLSHGCAITASLTGVISGNDAELMRVAGLEYGLTRLVCRNSCLLDRVESNIKCEFERVYEEVGEAKYLEIEPTVLWVYPDIESMNDVYSNTHWNVR